MTDRVNIIIDNGIANVRLTRPDKMNAMDAAMFDALIDAGNRLKTDNSVRAVILSGEGPAFCTGIDTTTFADPATGEATLNHLLGGDRTERGANLAQNAVMVWRDLPVPVIAAMHGAAFGAGFQLALGADMRVVAADTKLSVMEIKWGLVPDMGAFAILPSLVRDDIARELTFTGRIFSGEEAHKFGLATRLSDHPYKNAIALARDIAGKSPEAIRAAKRLFENAGTADTKTILAAETAEQMALLGGTNQREAIAAASAKRPPEFHDPE